MIEVKNLSRVFNKGKQNEVRACDDISIKLEDTGFYVIFGKSGAGKSSFMNALGGLDDYSSGTITYDNKTFKHMVSDKCRVANIGYIFQNYCLDANCNVYDNVALGLKSIGIKDEELIFNRVMTALANVGMTKYFRRNVTALSGGQQQRVAIARAMAKGSKIILADEPTGNLDDENTRVVMNILKELSKTRMVIVVTHEVDIVETYADKIIEIHDGKIVNESSGLSKDYDHDDKNKIFLKDLEKSESTVGAITVEQYGTEVPVNIKVINVGGKLYLKADNANLKILDDKSEVKLLNCSREEYKEKMKENLGIQLKDLEPIEPKSSGRVFRFKDCVPNKKQSDSKKYKRRNKFLKVSLALLVSVIVLVTAFWGGYFNQKELRSAYRLGNQVTISYQSRKDFKQVQEVLKQNSAIVKDVQVFDNANTGGMFVNNKEVKKLMVRGVSLVTSAFESQVDPNNKPQSANVPVNYLPLSYATELAAGRLPENDNEVVISSGVLVSHIEQVKARSPHYKGDIDKLRNEVIGSSLKQSTGDMGGPPGDGTTYRIVGLVEEENAYVYTTLTTMHKFTTGWMGDGKDGGFKYLPAGFEMKVLGKNTNKPEIHNEETLTIEDGVVYMYRQYGDSQINDSFEVVVDGEVKTLKYKAIVPADPKDMPSNIYEAPLIMTANTANTFGSYILATKNYIGNKFGMNNYGMIINVQNDADIDTLEAAIKELIDDADQIEMFANSREQKAMQTSNIQEMLNILGIVVLVMFAFIMLISILVIFANFTDKTKEIGVYRAIGVSKGNCIYKYFAENLRMVISFVLLVILIVGGLLMINSYFPISEENPMLNGQMMFLSWWQLGGIILVIIPLLMLISILPPLKYVRKSPIKILSEYDM